MSALDRLWAGWRSEYLSATTAEASDAAAPVKGGCVFCAILASGLPDTETHVLWRHPGGGAVALLNAYPYTSGHLMIMPTRHVADIETLDNDESSALWEGMQAAVTSVKAAYSPDGMNIGANIGRAAGAGVPGHVHVHVLPRWNGDTNFMTSVADARVLPEPLVESARRLRETWPMSS